MKSARFFFWMIAISLSATTCNKKPDPIPVPAPPSALASTSASTSRINLTWTDNSTNEQGFKIERAPGGTTSFAVIGTVGAGVTSYQDNGLSANTSYSYRVVSYNSAGNSGYSNTASSTTQQPVPTAPGNLAATATSATQVNLSWTDNSNNEQGFRIERAPIGTSTFVEIATVGSGIISYPNSGLAANTGYSYRIRSYNAAGNSDYSNSASATTQQAIPNAPSGLSAAATSTTQIDLAWTDNSTNEQGFRIERAPGGTTSFVEIATVAAGVVSYNSTGLTANTTYVYRVRSYNAAGNSGYSNTATATTQQAVTIPTAPSNLAATAASTTQIDLAWTDNSNNEQGFKVERAPGGTTSFVEIVQLGAGVTTYQSTGLTANTSYVYRVRSYNTAGNSAYSNTATATTQQSVTIPTAPSNLTATATSTTQIDLAWTDNSNNEQGFKVERAPGGTTSFVEIVQLGAGVTTYQSTGLTANTSYVYRVRSYNTAGNSAYSNSATATTQQSVTIPTAPSNLTATATSTTQIDLAWTDNSNNEQGFKVERAPGGTTSFVEIVQLGAGVTTYQSTGLTANTSYVYRVRSYNTAGNSAYSNTATATTQQVVTIPTAPSTLSATVASATQINLSWSDNSNNEQGFRIERAPGGTTSFAEITTVGAGIASYSNSGLAASTSYVYRVRSYNTAGNSAYSNTSTATTQPNPPPAPTVTAPSTSATGSFNVTITYTWPCIPSQFGCVAYSSDQYQLEESTTSSNSGFSIVHNSPSGSHTSPYDIAMTRTAGTYYYRARVNQAQIWGAYSSVVQVNVTVQPRRVKIINNCASNQFLNEVVRVKVAATSNGVYTHNDLLTNDPGQCLSLPGASITRLGNQTFDITVGDDYYVFVGMGRWETDLVTGLCPASSPYFKRNFTTLTNGNNVYLWTVVHVTGHPSGTIDWTIQGSLTGTDLRFTGPTFSTPLLFNATTGDPIP